MFIKEFLHHAVIFEPSIFFILPMQIFLPRYKILVEKRKCMCLVQYVLGMFLYFTVSERWSVKAVTLIQTCSNRVCFLQCSNKHSHWNTRDFPLRQISQLLHLYPMQSSCSNVIMWLRISLIIVYTGIPCTIFLVIHILYESQCHLFCFTSVY